jgi:predicted PurR-regulated permease PerM
MTEIEKNWPPAGPLTRTTVLIVAVVVAFAIGIAVVWLASTAIIAVLVGILLAVLLDSGASGLGRIMPLSRHLRLVILFVLVGAFIIGTLWWGGTILVDQATHFGTAMRDMLRRVNDFLQKGGIGVSTGDMDVRDLLPGGSSLLNSAKAVTSAAFDLVGIVAAILFLSAFFAWEPQVYKSIILSLLPQDRRSRVSEVLDLAGNGMREWMIGQSVSMGAIFFFSLFALMLVGMPYPVLLAVQAGLLTFIPTLGPFLAGVVIILAGLSQSVAMALYGVVTYVIIQFLETHLVTPLVQEQTVRLPPAVTLSLQVVAAFLFGILGIAFAVPIAAAGKIIIEELYVKDCLGGGWPVETEPSWLRRWSNRLVRKIRGR